MRSECFKSLRCLIWLGYDEITQHNPYPQIVVTLFRAETERPDDIKHFKHVATPMIEQYTEDGSDFRRLRICGLLRRGDDEAAQERCEDEKLVDNKSHGERIRRH